MRRIHKPLQPVRPVAAGLTRRFRRYLINRPYILRIQIYHLRIRHDPFRRRRFREHNPTLIDVPTQEYIPLSHTVFLGELFHPRVGEERPARRAEGTVRFDDDAVFLAQVDDLFLREERVVFDLVDGGDDAAVGEELFEVFGAVVADAYRLDFARRQQLLHGVPGLHVRVRPDHVARAVVGKHGELFVVAVRVVSHGPVDEVEVEVVDAEVAERHVQVLLDARVVRAPEFAGDEDFGARDAGLEGFGEAAAHFGFVAVAVGAVDVAVAGVDERVFDRGADHAGRSLPGS